MPMTGYDKDVERIGMRGPPNPMRRLVILSFSLGLLGAVALGLLLR